MSSEKTVTKIFTGSRFDLPPVNGARVDPARKGDKVKVTEAQAKAFADQLTDVVIPAPVEEPEATEAPKAPPVEPEKGKGSK